MRRALTRTALAFAGDRFIAARPEPDVRRRPTGVPPVVRADAAARFRQAMQEGRWEGWAPTAFMGGRVAGRRLGILGMGRIGQAVARRARAFGMQVHYHNRKRLRPEIEEAIAGRDLVVAAVRDARAGDTILVEALEAALAAELDVVWESLWANLTFAVPG